MNPEEDVEGDGAVLKTSTRQTIFLRVVGLVNLDKLKPGDLVGVDRDSYLFLDTLPFEYDSRVKAMEVDEKPTEDYMLYLNQSMPKVIFQALDLQVGNVACTYSLEHRSIDDLFNLVF